MEEGCFLSFTSTAFQLFDTVVMGDLSHHLGLRSVSYGPLPVAVLPLVCPQPSAPSASCLHMAHPTCLISPSPETLRPPAVITPMVTVVFVPSLWAGDARVPQPRTEAG